MAVKWTKVAVQPGGLDARSDPKTVPPTKVAASTNARFGVPGAVRKRQGFTRVADRKAASLADIPDQPLFRARAVAARGGELVAFDDQGPLVATDGRWLRRGSYTGGANAGGATLPVVGVKQSTALKLRQDMTLADRATSFGVTFYAWATDGGTSFVAAMDAVTGAALLPPTELDATANSRPRVVAAGMSVYVFWLREATGVLQVRIFNASHFPNSMSAAPTYTLANDVNTVVPVYDACASGARVLVAYNSTTATTIKFAHVTSDGATDGGFTSQATAAAVTVLCAVANNGGAFEAALVWAMDSNNHVDCRMFSAAKVALFATQTLNTSDTGFKNVTAAFVGGFPTRVTVLYEIAGASSWNQVVLTASCTTGGAVGFNGVFMRHSGLGSKLFGWTEVHSGLTTIRGAAILVFDSPLQPTYFLVDAFGSTMMARILPGEAGGLTPKAHLPQVELVATERAAAVLLGRTRFGDVGAFADRRLVACEFDLNVAAFPTVVAQNVLYVPGGVLGEYDGTYAGESGFLLFPENVTTSQAGGGSLTAVGTYSYKVFFEYINGQGQREISSTAGAITVTLTGANQTVQLTIPTLAHTNKGVIAGAKPIGIIVFRTTNGGTIFYRVSSPSVAVAGANGFVANNPGVDTVAFTDQMSDVTLTSQEVDYLSQGELDNIAPPPCSLIAVGNNRVFLAGFEDKDLVLASKLQDFGTALAFNDTLQIALPPADGSPVTAMAVLGEELIVFRQSHIYRVVGPGQDNTGGGGVFETPITVSQDIGCVNGASAVRTPAGILFQSAKGIYMFGAEGLAYVGADIERELEGETIVSTVSLPDRHEVRFVLLSGRTLVWEYLERRWSTWTVGGIHSCIWQGKHVILRDEAGVALVETEGTFQDDGVSYSFIVETGWLEFGGPQGYQRVGEMLLLAAKMGDHWLRIRTAYDYEDAWVDDVVADVSSVIGAATYGSSSPYGSGAYGGTLANGLPATNVYELLHFFSRPKCTAIKIRIEDVKRIDPLGVVDYPLLESFRLTDITLKVAPKAGGAKPGSDRQF